MIGFAVFSSVMVASSNYKESIRAWQQERDARLRSPTGWLSLVGLFWVNTGDNTIGSADSNNFVLPKGSTPARVGILRLEKGKITFIRPDGSEVLLSYDEDKPTVIHSGTVTFFVIKRGDRLAVRATDSASPVLKNFQGMKYFPIDPELHFQARFIPDNRAIPILNVLGETDQEESPGIVEFTYHGQQYRLRPIYEGKTLFFLFKDPTNKTETYQAGRMLNTPLPENGKVDLDFNRSYNPPCTFTPYATCPLPPRENTLPFPVTAGEMRYGKGHVEYAESP